MIVVAASIIAIGVVASAFLLRGLDAPRPSTERPMDALLRERMRDAVIATLKTGEAFHGLLFDVDDRTLILREARVLEPNNTSSRIPVDGELVLARAEVAYMQRP